MVNRNRYVGFCSHSLQQEHLPLNIEQIPVLTAHPSCVKKRMEFYSIIHTNIALGSQPSSISWYICAIYFLQSADQAL